MSFDLDDQDTREDVRRIAAALERTDEQLRQERHHDVLCVALEAYLRLAHAPQSLWTAADIVTATRDMADRLYPPPAAREERLQAQGFQPVPVGAGAMRDVLYPPPPETK